MKQHMAAVFAAGLLLLMCGCGGFYEGESNADAILQAAAEEAAANEALSAEEEPQQAEQETQRAEKEAQQTEEEAQRAAEETAAAEAAAPADGLRPEFVQAMDAYEAFYDEYCALMAEYSKEPSNASLLLRYGVLLGRMGEMDEAFAAWEADEMNAAEQRYYLEVSARVMQKLLDQMD